MNFAGRSTIGADSDSASRSQGLPSRGSPLLSVVVPIRNESRAISDLLDDLLGQTLPPEYHEIIVVDGHSNDGSRDIVARYSYLHKHIRLVDNPRQLASAGRNAGVYAALGRYVLFVDGHCRVPSKQMLADVVQAFEGGYQCVSRPQPLVPGMESRIGRAIAMTRSSVFGHLPGSMIYSEKETVTSPTSAGCGYSMELIKRLDGFDESFDAAEDVDFNTRVADMGLTAMHSNRFCVKYISRASWPRLFWQMCRYGMGRGQLWRKHPSSFSITAASPALLVLSMLCLSLLAQYSMVFLAGLIATCAVCILLGIGSAIAVRKDTCFSVAILAIPTIQVILAGAGCGTILGLVRARSSGVKSGIANRRYSDRGPNPTRGSR